MFFHALTIYAYQTDFLNIIGNTNIAIGKPSVTYEISYNINGTIFDCRSLVEEVEGDVLATNLPNSLNLDLFFSAPAHECFLIIDASINYQPNIYPFEYHVIHESRLIGVQKPFLHTLRTGLEGAVYEDNSTSVPIHWNVDDDDRSGSGGGSNAVYGEDYKQYEFLSDSGVDDDLYSIQAYITNVDFNASGCRLKIKTPDSMRLWFSQNKSALCCDTSSIYETRCNIVNWFNTHANSSGNRLYVEWVLPPNTTTNEYIEFYCNDVQFAKLRYKGYALTYGALPNRAERIYFEDRCELDGCEWRIAPGGGTHEHDRNSLAEAVDPNFTKYGEPFVATTSSPYGTNVYFLQNSIYNNFLCRCISMDTFGNQNHVFEDSDATAFFTKQYFWTYNYCNYSTSVPFSDILYYSGQFAATKAPSSWTINCHPSWAMFTSRFFNRPKIIHRAEQLEATRTIQKTYVKELL